MGYYLDLFLKHNSKPQSRITMVELFCANGCRKFYEEETPERVAVECLIPEYNTFFLIDFLVNIKDPPENNFAYVRLGSSPNRNWHTAVLKNLLLLADRIDFYIFDSLLNLEVRSGNMEQVVDIIISESSKMNELLGGTTNL